MGMSEAQARQIIADAREEDRKYRSEVANLQDARLKREADQPHEFCEVMCWHCGHRYISVHPLKVAPMKEWECSGCSKAGGMFRTGQPVFMGQP
jgi:hypothetical protein